MKYFVLLATAALLILAPQALRAHDYRDATMRFTVPDDYTYQPNNDEKQGITGFTATKDGLKITLFRIRTDKRIDRTNCLSVDDDKWLPGLSKFSLVNFSLPVWKRYDRASDYRNDRGYIRVYRYVDRKGIGFLVAENTKPEWEAADRIAASQRYKITIGHLFDRGLYLFNLLMAYIAMAICGVCMIYSIREHARNAKMWRSLLVIGTISGLLIYFEPFFVRKIWMIFTAIVLLVFVMDLNDADSDDDTTMDSYDGTGTTINHDF